MNLRDCFEQRHLVRGQPRPDIAKKEIENAKRHLENARKTSDAGITDLSIVATYTAMFHTARALLFRDGIKERSHVCVISYLKANYPELSQYVRILDYYRRQRHTRLYGIEEVSTQDVFLEGMQDAELFIREVEKLLA